MALGPLFPLLVLTLHEPKGTPVGLAPASSSALSRPEEHEAAGLEGGLTRPHHRRPPRNKTADGDAPPPRRRFADP